MNSTVIISVFEIILILIILSIQIYVGYMTLMRINILKTFLTDEDELSLQTYYLNQDELSTVSAEEVTESSKYTVPNRIDDIDNQFFRRGSILVDGKSYFSSVEADEEDALFVLTPTDYNKAVFKPLLDSESKKEQIASLRDTACRYEYKSGDEDNISLVKEGTVELQDDSKWLVTSKCVLMITKQTEDRDENADDEEV